MKLWEKGQKVNPEIEAFTVGNDPTLDQKLVRYDCRASKAHAQMLRKIGVLTESELKSLMKGLDAILDLDRKGEFRIDTKDEDCHTAIERFLTERCGDIGKKIHTARSRNDQVLTALRLYEKEELVLVKDAVGKLRTKLNKFISKEGATPFPGYTHMRRAMPSTVGMWLGAYMAALDDDIRLLDAVAMLINQSPLGTAAGFGVPVLQLDRKMTASLLGFSRVTENPVYAQMTRGKFEISILHACTQTLLDLNRLAADLILFSMEEFGLIELDDTICTGSSIMPHKRNPDVLELVRANYHAVSGEEAKLRGIIANLMSGYNRDLQLTKEPIMVGIDRTKSCLSVMTTVLDHIEIKKDQCKAAVTDEMRGVEEAYRRVGEGVPFRDAYRQVAEELIKKRKAAKAAR